jgi:probable F420-dependent oxidoreductase
MSNHVRYSAYDPDEREKPSDITDARPWAPEAACDDPRRLVRAMSARPLTFGMLLLGLDTVAEIVEDTRRAEAAGFDVVLLTDHVGFTAPLTTLVAMAHAAPTVQVSNLVLNAPMYPTALLARDLAGVDAATGGRLIISLGTGHVFEDEYIAHGLPVYPIGERVKMLSERVKKLRMLLSDPSYRPRPVQTPPRIMVTGGGNRVLTMAAQQADIVGISTNQFTEADLAERIGFVKEKAANRIDDIELSWGYSQVSLDDPSDLSLIRLTVPDAPEPEVRNLAAVLAVPVPEAIERLRRLNEELGISYFTFTKSPVTSWESFEKLIAALR